MQVEFKGLVWVGVRTKKFDALCEFYEKLLKLPVVESEPGFRVFDLPNGDRIEVFSEDEANHRYFTTGPVVGFLVENVQSTRDEMEKNGITFIGPIHGGVSKWSHFLGPDGNVYEITSR